MTGVAKIVTLILSLVLPTFATAQLALPREPAPTKQFVCVEKPDAYKLALGDIDGTLEDVAKRLDDEGRCGFLPALYLFTIDQYVDHDGTKSRVVEMMAYGQRVWGIIDALPPTGLRFTSH